MGQRRAECSGAAFLQRVIKDGKYGNERYEIWKQRE